MNSSQKIFDFIEGVITEQIDDIKSSLSISESEYLAASSGAEVVSSLDYWIFSILDDISRINLKCIRERDITNNEEIKDGVSLENKAMERLIFESVYFEFCSWHRKILEHFCQLKLLKSLDNKNIENIAKIYFMALDLKDLFTADSVNRDFYDIEPDWSLDHLTNKVEEFKQFYNAEESFSKLCFFLKNDVTSCIEKFKNPFIPDAIMLKKAFSVMDESDRYLAGHSIDQYHSFSKIIHAH